MPRPNAPCKKNGVDCPKRAVGCRRDCPDWAKYEEENAKYTGAVFEQYIRDYDINAYKQEGRSKYLHQQWKSRRK